MGKPTEPNFLKRHKEPVGEDSTKVPTATGSFQPAWGFRRRDSIVGSTKHAMDWFCHCITPHDYRDIVLGSDLSRVMHLRAHAMATVLTLSFTRLNFSFINLYLNFLTLYNFF